MHLLSEDRFRFRCSVAIAGASPGAVATTADLQQWQTFALFCSEECLEKRIHTLGTRAGWLVQRFEEQLVSKVASREAVETLIVVDDERGTMKFSNDTIDASSNSFGCQLV